MFPHGSSRQEGALAQQVLPSLSAGDDYACNLSLCADDGARLAALRAGTIRRDLCRAPAAPPLAALQLLPHLYNFNPKLAYHPRGAL